MGIFDRIKDAIFGSSAKAEETHPSGAANPQAAPSSVTPSSPPTSAASPTPAASSPDPSLARHAPSTKSNVDVAAVLDQAVAKKGEKLDWRHSIVDLMKALDLDSSLANRKELAEELGYSGDTSDSATMNTWLHKQVIQKLKENGGQVPAELN